MPLPETIAEFTSTTLSSAEMNQIRTNLMYLVGMVNAQVQVAGVSMVPSATNGANYGTFETSSNKVNFRTMNFSDSGTKLYAEFKIELPADYDGGTITYHVNWTANSTSTNSVVWGLQAVCYTDDNALDAAFGTAQEITDANKSTAYDLNQTGESSALTIAGTPAAGKLAAFRLYRDSGNGSDTLAVTASLISIVITYTRT